MECVGFTDIIAAGGTLDDHRIIILQVEDEYYLKMILINLQLR